MFTGIVVGRGVVADRSDRPGLVTFKITLPAHATDAITIGASISVEGVCLTVTRLEHTTVSFDVMQETLNRTTIGDLEVGSEVNIERSAKAGQEIGGHPISGHVDTTATITRIETPENNYVLHFRLDPTWNRYIFPKGFIAVNGASLTIAAVSRSESSFSVWLIPETLRLTTFGLKKLGDRVNIEIDRNTQVMVDTIWDFMQQNKTELFSLK